MKKLAKKLLATALSMALFLSVMPTGFLNVSAAEGDVNLASWFRMDAPSYSTNPGLHATDKNLKAQLYDWDNNLKDYDASVTWDPEGGRVKKNAFDGTVLFLGNQWNAPNIGSPPAPNMGVETLFAPDDYSLSGHTYNAQYIKTKDGRQDGWNVTQPLATGWSPDTGPVKRGIYYKVVIDLGAKYQVNSASFRWYSLFGSMSSFNAVQIYATPTATTEAEALSQSQTLMVYDEVSTQPQPGANPDNGKEVSATTNVQSRFFVLKVQAGAIVTVWNVELNGPDTPIGVATTYNVAYNNNGGTGTMANQSHTVDSSLALTSNTFTKAGYTFAGWNTAANGSGTSYTNSQSVSNLSTTQGATATLYAQWTANTYNVAYNNNGGTGTMANQSHTVDSSLALTSNTLTKAGYTFAGWNTAANGSGTSYTDAQSVNNLSTTQGATVNLYAQWTFVPVPDEFTVEVLTSEGNGSAVVTGDTNGVFLANEIATATATPDAGNKFVKWLDGDGNTLSTFNPHAFKVTKNTSIKAVFATENPTQATVTFRDINGVYLGQNTVAIGGNATAPTPKAKKGWTHTGWSSSITNVQADKTVTAVYTKNQSQDTYTVTVNNGTGDGTYDYDTEITLVADTAPEGFVFAYWSANGKTISFKSTFTTRVSKDITYAAVYAVSEPTKMPSVVINANDISNHAANKYVTVFCQVQEEDGYEYVAAGLQVSGDSFTSIAGTADAIKLTATGQYVIDIDTTSAPGTMYVKAFFTYVNTTTGISTTIYTDAVMITLSV